MRTAIGAARGLPSLLWMDRVGGLLSNTILASNCSAMMVCGYSWCSPLVALRTTSGGHETFGRSLQREDKVMESWRAQAKSRTE